MSTARVPAIVVDRSPNVVVGGVIGLAYLIWGVVAAAVAVGDAVGPGSTATDVDPLHFVTYLLTGLVLAVAAVRGGAKVANSTVGGCYLLVGVVLLFTGRSHTQLLMLNEVESILHLCSAAVLLGIGRTQE